MRWLLDTNACIDYLKRGTPAIRERLRATKPGDVYLCSIVKSELLYGAYKSQDPERTLRVQRAFFRCFPSLEFDDRCPELSRSGDLIGPIVQRSKRKGASVPVEPFLSSTLHNGGQ